MWRAYNGWLPPQPWAGAYPGRDGELAGNELARAAARVVAPQGVYGPYVQRRSETKLSPSQQRAQLRQPQAYLGEGMNGYNIVGFRGHGGYQHPMQGYNIIGEAAKQALAAQFAAMPPVPEQFPGLPQVQAQWGAAPRTVNEPRRLELPFDEPVEIDAGAIGVLLAHPQESIRMERLFIDSDNGSLAGIQVRAFFVGQQSQFAAGGVVPASKYNAQAVGGTIRGDTANPGIVVRLELFNGSAALRTFTASITGEAEV